MSYGFLANLTAIIHFITIVAVIIGLLVSFRYRRFRVWEAATLIAVIILWSYYGNCPFTILEQHLRDLAGESSNLTSVGFLPYYANKFMNISIPSKLVQRSTFFTGGALFTASIEWLSPVMHMELFKLRKTLHRLSRRVSV